MGRGIDLAALTSPEHARLVDDLKDQLLIVFLDRLGGVAEVPVAEVDTSGRFDFLMALDVQRGVFQFSLRLTPKEG